MTTMRAARGYPNERHLRLEEMEMPSIGAGEALVKVAAAGLSPAAIDFWQKGLMPLLPSVPGFEIAGTVEEIGPGVEEVEAGARVRVHPNLTCRRCEACLNDRETQCEYSSILGGRPFGPKAMTMYERYHDGGLAEYVRVPAWLLDPLPDEISFDAAAKVHYLGDALRALKLTVLQPGATLVVTAATGAMGAATIHLAPLFGVARIIAVARRRDRLDAVSGLAECPVDCIALDELADGWEDAQGLRDSVRRLAPAGPNAVIDYLPDGAGFGQALAALQIGGTALTMAASGVPLGLAPRDLMVNCWQIIGSRNCTRTDAKQVIELIRSGGVDPERLIRHRFTLADVNAGVDKIKDRGVGTWFVVVHAQASAASK